MTEYLIIGGSTKCATTSLFNYLSDHPDICPCRFKESRFFLHPNYPLQRKVPISDSINDYNLLFKHCNTNTIKLEATPDYLYSEDTAQKIKKILPDFKMIFILRNPIDRLVSWYKFSKQMHLLETTVTFEMYVNQQVENHSNKTQHFLALQHGKYINYLKKYINTISKENIHVIVYEDLLKNPKNVLMQLCSFINIDSGVYKNYHFEVFNPSREIKNKIAHKFFLKSKRFLRMSLKNAPYNLFNRLKSMSSTFQEFYFNKNSKRSNQIHLSDEIQMQLKAYYLKSNTELEHLLHKKLQWNE